jgi:hypothetical protein
MAVGFPTKTTYANGDVFSASDINDTNGTLNLATGAQWAAAKNKIINGDFTINQRLFTSNTTNASYNFDRFLQFNGGGTFTVTPQTFTPGAAPVAGYEATNYLRGITASQSASSDYAIIAQRIESVRTLAGQTATISFWAKANTGTPKIAIELTQNFGAGGSPSSSVSIPVSAVTISTSWVRYSATIAIPSITGKTIGTTANSSFLELGFWTSAGSTYNTRASSIGIQNFTADIWGVQVEQGSTMTAFQTASGSIGGEFALCQRYYEENDGTIIMTSTNGGFANSYSSAVIYEVAKRSTPTLTIYSGADQAGTSGSATWYAGGTGTVATADQEANQKTFFGLRRSGTSTNTLVAFSYTSSAEL